MTKAKPSKKQAAGVRIPEKAHEIAQRVEGTLRERAMLVRFSIGRWYGTGADESVTREVAEKHGATGDIGSFTKRVMSREFLAAINQITNESRKYHKSKTLMWGESGQRVLPATLFFEYKREMTAYEMRFNAAVEEFLSGYGRAIESERTRLGGFFNASDYPDAGTLRQRFRFALDVEALPNAADFRVDLGADEIARIQREIEERVSGAMQEASHEVWERLHEMVAKVREKLSDADGQVRASIFEHLRDLVAVLPALNITGDARLTKLGEQVSRELLSGTDLASLREDDLVRKDVAKKADAILGAMESFMKGGK